ncbi:RNA polymerase sigma factor [Agromyces cerinus]|uniref:RNA polymerase, sigma subunit, ECF family n=1 Tax=Agromyces cerinus subsp. cerinus TaxID=232089 RepID=A0A1N6FAI5_9MICO|nr:sigma-70 family RNA polymerase sigma factor [Agromyces cerinus]SIN92252.1 RNA polymerase, sigma subunit, ECF family [Agromyces cerinus subsp. cerinus]
MSPTPHEDLLRARAPQVLAALLRQYGVGQFDVCEDAVQEALLAAHRQWPEGGVPDDTFAWLLTAARRRMIDRIRSDHHRRDRERNYVELRHPLSDATVVQTDDSVQLLRLCCHPVLTRSAQVALTLRAVAGLTTAQIAHAYLLPEATVAQRISRAKARIRAEGAGFPPPLGPGDRLDPVLDVVYVMFTEGHTSSAGHDANDLRLSDEAIRLAGLLHAELPDQVEVAGLLALMMLTDARRAARTDANGALIPLDEQDRSLWDRDAIREATDLLDTALVQAAPSAPGPFAIQAAIAALHDEAPSTETTDWPQILALYRLLEQTSGNPIATLNRAVAEAMVHGPEAGLATVDALTGSGEIPDRRRLSSVRAHLLERAGRSAEAVDEYRDAAGLTLSIPERDYLLARARRLDG